MTGKFLLFVFSAFTFPAAVQAQTAAEPDMALEQAQAQLTDPAARGAMLEGNRKGQDLDAALQKMAGKDGANQVYSMSSEIMADLVSGTGGDPDKLQKVLENAQRNPAAFAESLSAVQKQKIKATADEIEKSKTTTVP